MAVNVDLHRHDEFSTFDGYGAAIDLARLAKQNGLMALGLTNHGNTSGLVRHYFACQEMGIKPVLGVECYFQPNFDIDKRKYHLCLFAKNLKGYENINRIQTEAIENFHYNPVVTFKLLKKYNEGIICSTACVGGLIPQLLINGKYKLAKKAVKIFVDIFGKDFYFEIMPYKLHDSPGLQERINTRLLDFAKEHKIKCILTSDSHYGDRADLPTYLKMHEIAGRDPDKITVTYKERYMPKKNDLLKRFKSMHKNYKYDVELFSKHMEQLIDSVEDNILEQLPIKIPTLTEGVDSKKALQKEIIKGLKQLGKYTKPYLKRCKEEYEVIVHHGFEDYFLIVQDYVKWAKKQKIIVGPGRGSVCNCLIAYALQITNVDSLFFNLDFSRFLRLDKKKLPDIDLDFETNRRHEVIKYVIDKYPGQAAQICSYGLYKTDNLLNDLVKVCGVESKAEINEIKKYVKSKIINSSEFNYDEVAHEPQCQTYNRLYDNIVLHFSKLFMKTRYIGTHAAGVVIVGDDLLKYTSLIRRGSQNNITISTAYDLNNLEKINVVKYDILGLNTLSVINELEELTGDKFCYDWLNDKEIYKYFREGKTDGIFQFEKPMAKEILKVIDADCFDDLVAATSMNRPGPLSLDMHSLYAENKFNKDHTNEVWSRYTNNTYGTIVYQEQILQIAKNIGLMSPSDADKILKFMKGGSGEGLASAVESRKAEEKYLTDLFIKGAKKSVNIDKTKAIDLFSRLLTYSFNQGHAVGYTLISLEQMYYKVHYPELFWYATMKYTNDDSKLFRYKMEAIREGNVIFLPHVNYNANFSLQEIDGEKVITEGYGGIKHVGVKASEAIQNERLNNGPYKSLDNFLERIPKRVVNKKVISQLIEYGALEFNKQRYINRVKKYNSTMYARAIR